MTINEKLKIIEEMIPGINFESANGECPSNFGLENYCRVGSFKDTCKYCWIDALEEVESNG